MKRRPLAIYALAALGLPSCGTTGGYTVKLSLGYQGVSVGVEIDRPAQPAVVEPPLPVDGKGPVPAPLL